MVLMLRKTLLFAWLLSSAESAPYPHGEHSIATGGQKAKNMTTGRAIYFLTNDAKNAVVALPINADGTVCNGTITPTGGAGSNAIDSNTKAAAAPDALVGQSALTIAGESLFAVNAGSNTLTMLSISASDPTKLTMVGKPVSLPGEFPNTVAASLKNSLVCVGTTGAKAGISCSIFSTTTGLSPMDSLRPFDLKQTTPPLGPTNTVSQTFFSKDQSLLLTTVKGDPTVNNTGFLSVFPVQSSACGASSLSTTETRSSPPGTAVLFGSAPIPGSPSLFVTDASFGAAVLALNPSSMTASLVSKQAIQGQKATCWATISSITNSAFVTDVGVNHIVEMSLEDASIIQTTDLSANGDPGLIDLKAAGGFVYALSPGNGTQQASVTVVDVSGGQGTARQVQHFLLGGLGVGKNAQGMVALV
ncbi:hypothetical protein K432DRAFT_359600 [Lepidopterella palustris CBS 459.81]|uniref:3-carboxymuconate cyclase n=1 Tax=Lepidopterella palustris CBS 459.81 TaxID=1314670 RepID=A0A8E2E407_9PEZI|nr:hypothetical protein K432DRAFT_359600 [Lepidopterella palustris CBS 459.81]